jgi:hypothetical protein
MRSARHYRTLVVCHLHYRHAASIVRSSVCHLYCAIFIVPSSLCYLHCANCAIFIVLIVPSSLRRRYMSWVVLPSVVGGAAMLAIIVTLPPSELLLTSWLGHRSPAC